MHITKSEDGTQLMIGGLGETELEMLRGVRDAADPTACPEAERRLFPAPIADADEHDFDTIADWKEFVVPDLRTRFDDALDQLESDVADARQVRKLPMKRFVVKLRVEHVELWYSALNQARLVLQEKYKLPSENTSLSLEDLFAKGQWRAYFQSRFYAEVQCWLLEAGMPDGWR
ncbi:MAG: DUF2017 family protein [Verrucomicrobia bacterium]|nr:DUF2017 family protein [Verrucomicrobiota bacterium]